MSSSDIVKLMYDWNPKPNDCLLSTKIDDDTLRDGFQGAFVHKPGVEDKQTLLSLSVEVGVQSAVLGFPAVSAQERMECAQLLQYLVDNNHKLVPSLLARACIDDLQPIVELNQQMHPLVEAAIYLGSSPLRCHVEHWSLQSILDKCESACHYMAQHNCPFSFSIEDATRTPPEHLKRIIDIAVGANAASIDICDTAGTATPAGAQALVTFVKTYMDSLGSSAFIRWHGHNDRGLALANSIAAAQVGADFISGSFLGIGERTGNTSLEQVIMYLAQCGSQLYRTDKLMDYCQALSRYAQVTIAPEAPLVGAQAFATCTGTHAAAILKARELGIEFEDYIFSGVPASKLGRQQQVLLGPTSGMATSYYVLKQLKIEPSQANARALLDYAKSQDHLLGHDDVQQFFYHQQLHQLQSDITVAD